MRIYISGGCKNGKSTYGEKLAVAMKESEYPLYYVATMKPKDEEDDARIARHRENRENLGFHTVEIGQDIRKLLDNCNPKGCFLIDSTTALLANEMFLESLNVNHNVYYKIAEDLCYLLERIENIIIVSDYIFSDAKIYDSCTQNYRKGLAYIDKSCARICDTVLEACFGGLIIHKGGKCFEHVYKKII